MAETSYPYAVGRIKVLESHFIDRAKWNRLWEADEAEALKILEESGYGSEAQNKSDVERMIDVELSEARALINEISPEPALTDLFLLPTDGHNIKTILKGILQRVEVDELLLEGGSIPLEIIKKAVEYGDYEGLPPAFCDALTTLDGEKDSRIISAVIDNAVYAQIMHALDKGKKNPLMKRYFTAKIDFTNILTVIRANVLNWEVSRVKQLLLTGGEIELQAFVEAVGMAKDQLPKQLGIGVYSTLLKSLLDEYVQSGSVTALEQQLDDAAFAIIHEEWTDSFGIGPIANYLLTKLSEGKALRVMFAGKRAGVKVPLSELGIA